MFTEGKTFCPVIELNIQSRVPTTLESPGFFL